MKRLTELDSTKKRWPLIVAGFLVTCMAASLVLLRHRLPYAAHNLGQPQLSTAIMRVEDAHILAFSRGVKLWCISANAAELSRDRRIVSLTGITDGRVYQNGAPVLMVTAGKVRYDTFSGDLVVSRGVCARSPKGQVLRTETLMWNASRMVVASRGSVRFNSALGSATARALTLDLGGRQLKLVDVFGKINLEGRL
ncbi:MAG: hypothetical protein QHI38_02385 [Armatimonadota bacterium]|nr:hypothetical protein [Armatimonadota bacterium]